MINFKPRRVNFEDKRTPVMFNDEIDELAHSVIKDYRPELLKEPGKIDVEHFLEHYLGAEVQFHDIYNEDPSKPIRALTAFTKGGVKVFDRENNRISIINVQARTVILDNEVMEPGKEGVALFSGCHEGGHLNMHWDVYVDKRGVPYEKTENGEAAVICCRRSNIECVNFSYKERTLSDWQEHQADYYASALTMPNITFRPFVMQFLRENGIYKGHIRIGRSSDLDILADELLPDYISETYGVSKRAARIKLRKCDFVSEININDIQV